MRILIVFFAIFNFSLIAFAIDQNRSESAVFIPWVLTENYLNRKLQDISLKPKFEFSKRNLKLQVEELAIPVNGMAVKVYPKLSVHLSNEKKEINLLPSLLEIEISPFSIDQVIQRRIGDTILNIRIKVSCNGVKIINNQLLGSSRFEVKKNGSIFDKQNLQFSNLNLDWSNDWQISHMECSGLQGATEFFKSTFLNYIQNRKNIIQMIENEVYLSLQDYVSLEYSKLSYQLSFETLKNIKIENLKLSLSSYFKSVDSGIVLQAFIDDSNDYQANQQDDFINSTFFNMASKSRFNESDKIEVLIEPQILENLLQKKLSTFTYSNQLNEIPEFKRVLNSRWIQFFIWPDLFNYKKKSVFNQIATGQFKNLKLTSDQVNVEAELLSKVTSQRKNKTWNYIESKARSTFFGRWFVSDQGLSVELIGKPTSVKIKMVEAYVKKFNASTYLPEKIIKSALVSKLKKINLNLAIPNFQIAEYDLNLSSIIETDKLFRIQFQANSQN